MTRRPNDHLTGRVGTLNGYNYLIKSDALNRPLGPYKYWAKVDRLVKHGDPAVDEIPDSALYKEHWGETADEALSKAEAEARANLCANRAAHTPGSSRFVCETHPDKPIGHDGCEGAGMPCPDCQRGAGQ